MTKAILAASAALALLASACASEPTTWQAPAPAPWPPGQNQNYRYDPRVLPRDDYRGGESYRGNLSARDWGQSSSSGSGRCQIDIHIDDDPAGWLGPQGANQFGDFLKYTICLPLIPKDRVTGKPVVQIEPVKAPSWVKNPADFEGVGTKGSYVLPDGRKVSWRPK